MFSCIKICWLSKKFKQCFKSRTIEDIQGVHCQNHFKVLEVHDSCEDEEYFKQRSRPDISLSLTHMCTSKYMEQRFKYCNKKRVQNRKTAMVSLSKENDKCFHDYEECDSKLSNVHSLLHMSKKKIKICRTCNYKKRSCALSPFSCKAYMLSCSKCEFIVSFWGVETTRVSLWI